MGVFVIKVFRRSPRLQGGSHVFAPPAGLFRPQTGRSTLRGETRCTLLPATVSQALFRQIIGRPAALD